LDRYRDINPLHSAGKDDHPCKAIKKEASSHDLPANGEDWNIKEKVDPGYRQSRNEIVDS
jgi:hypothetical protein